MNIGVRYGRTAALAVVAAAVAAFVMPAGAKADASAPAECPAARVTGVSAVLDTLATGSAAGPSVLFGVALVPLSQPLPAPLDGVQSQVASQAAAGVQQMRADAPGQIDQLRAGVAPLAAGNELADQGVQATASALDAAAEAGGPTIAPADTSLRETATIVRANQEGAARC